MTVSIAGLAVILAIIVITIFCVQRKRLSNAVQRERQRLRNLMETASDGNVRDPPPRYSSRQDLAVVNAAYNHDEVGCLLFIVYAFTKSSNLVDLNFVKNFRLFNYKTYIAIALVSGKLCN